MGKEELIKELKKLRIVKNLNKKHGQPFWVVYDGDDEWLGRFEYDEKSGDFIFKEG